MKVNEYKYEIDKLRDEIKEVNRKYYEQKKREKLEQEAKVKFLNEKCIQYHLIVRNNSFYTYL